MNAILSPVTAKIFKYELSDVVRSKWVPAYAAFFLVVTDALFRFGGGSTQVMLSLLNVVLLLIPLVCMVFGTMYFYNGRAFTELMLAQPVRRTSLFGGLFGGLALPLAAGYAAGVSIPFAIHGVEAAGQTTALGLLIGVGVLLTLVFTALAYLVAVAFQERVKGLAVAVLAWLALAIVYDGLVLTLASAFAHYPLERPMIALTLLNPVDLARVLLLLQFDIAALMGYTGAVFERFFGSGLGMGLAFGTLMGWLIVPLMAGRALFRQKDF